MKRPLAIFGACYLLAQLLAAFVPQAAIWALAVFFVLPGCVLLACKNAQYPGFFVAAGAIMIAMLLRNAYFAVAVAPLEPYMKTTQVMQVTGVVLAPEKKGAGDFMDATIAVEAIDSSQVPYRFLAQIADIPAAPAGERVRFPATLGPVPQGEYRLSFYADGIFVAGSFQRYKTPESALQRLGFAHTPQAYALRVRDFFSAGIRRYLPYDIGAIASAMCVGDTAALTVDIRNRFRSAGLSHTLVVSGLHLSAVTAAVYALLRRRAGQRVTALACCCAALLFTVLAGATPSLVRACVSVLLLHGGRLLHRQSDALTSLAVSAILLCLQNPFAATDIGLLLSYSATLGMLYGNWSVNEHLKKQAKIAPNRWQCAMRAIGTAVVLSACTTAFTLPVIMAIGGGISLLSVACNLLAIPFLGIIVSTGLLLSLFAVLPGAIAAALAHLAGFLCGVGVSWLNGIAHTAEHIPFAMVYISGAAAVCTYLCLMAWVAFGYFTQRNPRVTLATSALFLVLCYGAYSAMDANVVRIALVGAQQNPSVVVTQRQRTLVLYRGADSGIRDIQRYLEQQNRYKVDLLFDLRTNKDTEDTGALAQTLFAQKAICVEKEVVEHRVLSAFYDIIISIHHQSEGNAAVINVSGFTFGTAAGKVDFSVLPPLAMYAAGSSAPQNLVCQTLLLPNFSFPWVEDYETAADTIVLRSGAHPQILLRAGRSVTTRDITTQDATLQE